jgi:site-specific DNA-methyltransferase (adenine-specific)
MANENMNIIGAGQDTARPAPKINTITCGDCLEVMQGIPDKSVDMVLCDLPYGVTSRNKWDIIIPMELLWNQYLRVCQGAIVLTAIQPFTSVVVCSNLAMFKYQWIWKKQTPTGFLNAKKQPLRTHEDVLVFYSYQPTYNPQMWTGKPYRIAGHVETQSKNYGKHVIPSAVNNGKRFPVSVLNIDTEANRKGNKLHPTQKPVALFEYLIRTYTNEGDTVLDSCIGSGTTAIACINTGRNYIGIEKEEKYCRIAEERIHALRSPAQNTMEICHTAPNTAIMPDLQVSMVDNLL